MLAIRLKHTDSKYLLMQSLHFSHENQKTDKNKVSSGYKSKEVNKTLCNDREKLWAVLLLIESSGKTSCKKWHSIEFSKMRRSQPRKGHEAKQREQQQLVGNKL
jgi:hypothetical protein